MKRTAIFSWTCLFLLTLPLMGQAAEVTNSSTTAEQLEKQLDQQSSEQQKSETKKTAASVKPVTVVNSDNGTVYAPGSYGVILKYIGYTQDDFYSGTDSTSYVRSSSSTLKVRERSVDKTLLTLRAGLWKNIDARVIIPYLNKELDRQSATMDYSDSNSGIGDIKVISRYQVLSQKEHDPFNLAVGVGVKVPTGDTDSVDSTGKNAGFLQPGSGSWDPLFEIGAHKVVGRHWFSTSYSYQLSTEGELGAVDIEKSDVFQYNAAYAYALCSLLDVELELNGEVDSKAEKDGVTQENTGGHIIYITPGVHFKLSQGIHLDFGVALPVYRDLNGTQVTEDYRLVSKLALKF